MLFRPVSNTDCTVTWVRSAIVIAGLALNGGNAIAAEPELQEVVVTATRREESASKVAVSITALTQESMDERGIKDFGDVARFTPGVKIDNGGGNTNSISIRGIGSSGGSGTTGIYIDDTPIQIRGIGFNSDDALPKTFDLSRVEVLRGPQGTLFGAGSEGGTVRYILTPPSLQKTNTYARAEVAATQDGQPSYEVGVAGGTPLIDGVLGVRASVWYRHDGGWIDRVDPTTSSTVDRDTNSGNSVMLRLAGLWQPISGLTVSPSVIYQQRKLHDVDGYWPILSNADSGRFVSGNPDRRPVPDEYYLPALKLSWDFEQAQFISNSSFYHRSERSGYQGTLYNLGYYQTFNSPGGPPNTDVLPFVDPTLYPLIDSRGVHLPPGLQNYRSPATVTNQQENYTQEIRLQSVDPNSRFTWTVGAFWSLNRIESTEEINDPMIDDFFQGVFGLPASDESAFGYPLLPGGDDYINRNIGHDRQLAGFGELSYRIWGGIKATGGLRVSKTEFTSQHYADGPQNSGADYGQGQATETPVTPKFSLQWQINDANMVYGTYAKGFRIGGANAPLPPGCEFDLQSLGLTAEPESYKSDTTQSYEVGAKSNIAGRVKLDGSLYYIKWNGIQQNVYLPGCGLQFIGNFGQAVSKGFDLEADFILGHGLAVETAIGHTIARFTSTTPGNIVVEGDTIQGSAGAPSPWTVSVGAQYSFTVAEHPSFLRVDWEYQQRNRTQTPAEDPASSQYNPFSFTPATTHFASLRLGTTVKDLDFQFFVDNLLNAHPLTGYNQSDLDKVNPDGPPAPLLYGVTTFRPRTFGLDVFYHQ